MKAGDYPYPADEFDAADARGGPRGVHRAPRSRRSRVLPFVVVVLLFPLLAYGVVTWLSDWEGLQTPGGSDQGQEAPADDGEATEPATDAATEPATEEETTPPEPVAPPPPVPDLAATVTVYNSTSRSGLASGAAERVEEAGFTSVSADDWDGEDPDASVVYHATAADVATAQLVAQTLGITQVVESAEQAPKGVVVVLAGDYTP
ncbi:LytR C-terminal domain-containing protein [Actinotalea ferrariae]|uniref:LytR C-terminal domain-containing protein n=1 Tax=Actinotalea ferrariae TaxID=1386098 RepID=UPI001C8B517E|nr:LytR C-terminal domain-containing protein [Actinotalea ferrariae]MBX9245793.1 LytR C-terminal domain-containing protein [Actinotalea ferrariae]